MQEYTHILHTDGSCLANPGGSGGYGFLLIDTSTGEVQDNAEGFFSTTNNRMEVMAAIEGLAIVPRGAKVELVSDSQYLVKTLLGAFAKRKNRDLWAALDRAMEGKQVSVRWIRGHASDPDNNQCDIMAVRAAHMPTREDVGYADRFKGPKAATIQDGAAWEPGPSDTSSPEVPWDGIPAPDGEECYTGEKRKIHQPCMDAIEALNQNANPRFKDFAGLKIGGRDGWSTLADPGDLVGPETVQALKALLPTDKDVVACIRWYGRGLKFRHCIRKALVDAEICENALKARYR